MSATIQGLKWDRARMVGDCHFYTLAVNVKIHDVNGLDVTPACIDGWIVPNFNESNETMNVRFSDHVQLDSDSIMTVDYEMIKHAQGFC